MRRFVVASGSPRRKQLLSFAGYDFDVIPSDADESLEKVMHAFDAVKELSKRKALSVSRQNPGAVVLGCDTVVSLGGKILGKPHDEKEAFSMLSSLSGKEHEVYTGVYITDGEKSESFVSCARVEFYALSKETIDSYIATREPMDKAGAYGIQGLGNVLVKKINGDYFTVMGLPMGECARALSRFGINGKVKI